MEDSRVRTVFVPVPRALFEPRRLLGAVLALALASGCAGRYAGPRTLAGLGSAAVIGGSVTWAAGQGFERDGRAAGGVVTTGFVGVAVGLVAIVAAGGWMALAVSCNVDPDCDEEEQCREIPAPPGGIPYKQCMSR
jgi:hypothetical protein